LYSLKIYFKDFIRIGEDLTKPEEVIELFQGFLERNEVVFMAIEEANTLGYNMIHFLVDLDVDDIKCFISFQYISANNELIPIAFIMEFNENISKELRINSIANMLNDVGGYIFGLQSRTGILVPLLEISDIKNVLENFLPMFISKIFKKNAKISINRYELDYVSV